MNAPFLRPRGCPIGIDPADWREALLHRIDIHAALLSALIDALDVMEGDADIEPWLGANELIGSQISQLNWCTGATDGLEDENEHGGDVQDEPHDYMEEGNGDFCATEEMSGLSGMTDDEKIEASEECDRLVAQLRAMLSPAKILHVNGGRP